MVAIASFFSNVVVDGILFSFGLLQQPIMESFIASGQTHVTVGSLTWMSSILNGCYLMGGMLLPSSTLFISNNCEA